MAPGLSTCLSARHRTVLADELELIDDPSPPGRDPFDFPLVQAPNQDAPAFQHPPARELMVVTASKVPDWGVGTSHEVKYETLIWRPADPLAPGPIHEAEVERRSGIVASDGQRAWELEVTRAKVVWGESSLSPASSLHPRSRPSSSPASRARA